MSPAIPSKQALYLFDHLFLPPKLSKDAIDEETAHQAEVSLLKVLSHQVSEYQRAHDSPPELEQIWTIIKTMLQSCERIASTASLSPDVLNREVKFLGTSSK